MIIPFGISILDVLYHISTLDPPVRKAIEHLGHTSMGRALGGMQIAFRRYSALDNPISIS